MGGMRMVNEAIKREAVNSGIVAVTGSSNSGIGNAINGTSAMDLELWICLSLVICNSFLS